MSQSENGAAGLQQSWKEQALSAAIEYVQARGNLDPDSRFAAAGSAPHEMQHPYPQPLAQPELHGNGTYGVSSDGQPGGSVSTMPDQHPAYGVSPAAHPQLVEPTNMQGKRTASPRGPTRPRRVDSLMDPLVPSSIPSRTDWPIGQPLQRGADTYPGFGSFSYAAPDSAYTQDRLHMTGPASNNAYFIDHNHGSDMDLSSMQTAAVSEEPLMHNAIDGRADTATPTDPLPPDMPLARTIRVPIGERDLRTSSDLQAILSQPEMEWVSPPQTLNTDANWQGPILPGRIYINFFSRQWCMLSVLDMSQELSLQLQPQQQEGETVIEKRRGDETIENENSSVVSIANETSHHRRRATTLGSRFAASTLFSDLPHQEGSTSSETPQASPKRRRFTGPFEALIHPLADNSWRHDGPLASPLLTGDQLPGVRVPGMRGGNRRITGGSSNRVSANSLQQAWQQGSQRLKDDDGRGLRTNRWTNTGMGPPKIMGSSPVPIAVGQPPPVMSRGTERTNQMANNLGGFGHVNVRPHSSNFSKKLALCSTLYGPSTDPISVQPAYTDTSRSEHPSSGHRRHPGSFNPPSHSFNNIIGHMSQTPTHASADAPVLANPALHTLSSETSRQVYKHLLALHEGLQKLTIGKGSSVVENSGKCWCKDKNRMQAKVCKDEICLLSESHAVKMVTALREANEKWSKQVDTQMLWLNLEGSSSSTYIQGHLKVGPISLSDVFKHINAMPAMNGQPQQPFPRKFSSRIATRVDALLQEGRDGFTILNAPNDSQRSVAPATVPRDSGTNQGSLPFTQIALTPQSARSSPAPSFHHDDGSSLKNCHRPDPLAHWLAPRKIVDREKRFLTPETSGKVYALLVTLFDKVQKVLNDNSNNCAVRVSKLMSKCWCGPERRKAGRYCVPANACPQSESCASLIAMELLAAKENWIPKVDKQMIRLQFDNLYPPLQPRQEGERSQEYEISLSELFLWMRENKVKGGHGIFSSLGPRITHRVAELLLEKRNARTGSTDIDGSSQEAVSDSSNSSLNNRSSLPLSASRISQTSANSPHPHTRAIGEDGNVHNAAPSSTFTQLTPANSKLGEGFGGTSVHNLDGATYYQPQYTIDVQTLGTEGLYDKI